MLPACRTDIAVCTIPQLDVTSRVDHGQVFKALTVQAKPQLAMEMLRLLDGEGRGRLT
jgi:hypothetical protein